MLQNDKYSCGQCHYEFDRGVSICQGCLGKVVFGASAQELSNAGKVGGFFWAAGTLLAVYAIPQFLNAQLGMTISTGWGVGSYGLLVAAGAAFFGYIQGERKERSAKYRLVRTFK